MRPRRARALALLGAVPVAVLLTAPAAHADDEHTLTASCNFAWGALGSAVLVAHAEAAGQTRPISTDVTCTADGDSDTGPAATAHASSPGPVAVAFATMAAPVTPPLLCVTASAYWADGYRSTSPEVCYASPTGPVVA
jgi:hypothetical protein